MNTHTRLPCPRCGAERTFSLGVLCWALLFDGHVPCPTCGRKSPAKKWSEGGDPARAWREPLAETAPLDIDWEMGAFARRRRLKRCRDEA